MLSRLPLRRGPKRRRFLSGARPLLAFDPASIARIETSDESSPHRPLRAHAHQDAEDDALIGIRSTARLFGAHTHQALVLFYGLAMMLIGVALASADARWPAWLGLAAFAAHLAWQIARLRIENPELCLRLFKSNRDAGLLLFAGLLVDAVMRAA